MSGARLKRMIETYMEGRESSTMKSYQSSFAKLGMICRKLELSLSWPGVRSGLSAGCRRCLRDPSKDSLL